MTTDCGNRNCEPDCPECREARYAKQELGSEGRGGIMSESVGEIIRRVVEKHADENTPELCGFEPLIEDLISALAPSGRTTWVNPWRDTSEEERGSKKQ